MVLSKLSVLRIAYYRLMVAVQVVKMSVFESILKMFIEQNFSGLPSYKSQSAWPFSAALKCTGQLQLCVALCSCVHSFAHRGSRKGKCISQGSCHVLFGTSWESYCFSKIWAKLELGLSFPKLHPADTKKQSCLFLWKECSLL